MLIAAAIVWIVLHIGVAGTRLRGMIVRRIGENGFRAAFALASVVVLIWLILSFRNAGTVRLWVVPPWVLGVLIFAMLVASLLFVGSVTTPNPTMVRGERFGTEPVRGMQRITRHPMLWSFAIWAAVHMIGNGDTAALVFFGAFLVAALAGMPSIDAKLAHRAPATWSVLSRSTSIMPFGAIAMQRNRLAWSELGWRWLALSVLLWAVLLWVHPAAFGVSALPG
ncbi:MAG TPA: NnrU family protein [Acetobacteraceae bacterium]|nr:NnrU family protein [Acetobacteraceae bacterium]